MSDRLFLFMLDNPAAVLIAVTVLAAALLALVWIAADLLVDDDYIEALTDPPESAPTLGEAPAPHRSP